MYHTGDALDDATVSAVNMHNEGAYLSMCENRFIINEQASRGA